MKAIYSAILESTGTTDMAGNNCEWAWTERGEEEYGREWDGNVAGYVGNLDWDGDEYEIVDGEGCWAGSIHNLPEGAIVVAHNGEPCSIYWAEEVENEGGR